MARNKNGRPYISIASDELKSLVIYTDTGVFKGGLVGPRPPLLFCNQMFYLKLIIILINAPVHRGLQKREYFAPIIGVTESDLDSDSDSESESIESVDPQSLSTVLDSQLSSDSS